MMKISQHIIVAVALLSFSVLAGGCSDTWQGVKEDTSKNLDKAGNVVVKAGEKIKSE